MKMFLNETILINKGYNSALVGVILSGFLKTVHPRSVLGNKNHSRRSRTKQFCVRLRLLLFL